MKSRQFICPDNFGFSHNILEVSLSGLNPQLLDAGGVHGVLVVWHDAATDVKILSKKYHVFLNHNTIFSFGKFKFSDVNPYLLLDSMVI